MDKLKVDQFLAELTELSRKYGIGICGCGCCGSPYLNDLIETTEFSKGLTKEDLAKRAYVIDFKDQGKYGLAFDMLEFKKA